MARSRQMVELTSLIVVLAASAAAGQAPARDVVFQEDFADPALPGWQGAKLPAVKYTRTQCPGGIPGLSMESREVVNTSFSVSLPTERIAGKAVLLEVWRKAENVTTGARHYFNAKSMLSWKAKSEAKPKYSSTLYSDFSGTSDWDKHMYVMQMPKDLEWARVTIGLQACAGKASWAGLVVSVDPRFPNQHAVERFLEREERRRLNGLDAKSITIKRLNGGIIQVFTEGQYVPRRFWNDAVRKAVLASVEPPAERTGPPDARFRAQLARAMQTRAEELQAGLKELKGGALSDRVYEIASLQERVRQIGAEACEEKKVRLRADAASELPVSPFIFGNNINTQNLTAAYDSARGKLQDEFLKRVRPMAIPFLRYPGGCNADVFNWKDTVGPLDQRKDIVNYHNGTGRGVAKFGVDEYLRFCEQEGMVPIITTAFCKDHPAKVDPNDHPNGIRHKFVFAYLKSAPERVQLAADWVEYCNGSVDTPYGKLRAKNGHPKPYSVKYWEIGNESYGPDPTGSCSAEEYAKAFPAYVKAMKARDPSVKIAMNGCSRADWNEPLLRIAGKHADAFQFHIYRTPRINNYSKLEGRPHQATEGMRLADNISDLLRDVDALIRKHLGRPLPIIISEFGMGNARNREFMTSVTSPVLVADMWRTFVESQVVFGANKWCLFTGYWFSQVQGPTLREPDAPYYNRPEQIMHVIYARCRSKTRLAVDNEASEGAKAVVFKRPDSYGVVLISREAVSWQSVVLELPGARRGKAACILLTAGHPFLGNENDHGLVSKYEFQFDYAPSEPIIVPSNSVVGLIVPR